MRSRRTERWGPSACPQPRAAPHLADALRLRPCLSSQQTARPPPTAPRTARSRRRRSPHSSHPSSQALRELKLANQHLAFSQAAEEALAASLEKNETLIKLTIELRSTHAREAINKALTRNQDKRRKARVAAGGADTRKVAGVNVADWAAEADRVASSSPPYAFGRPTGQLPKGVAADACYSLTGEALWGRAKPEERLALVRAFASNSHVVCENSPTPARPTRSPKRSATR